VEPAYVDIHIHTSNNPEALTDNYDYEALERGVKAIACDKPFLLSFSDHNTINKHAYLNLPSSLANAFLIGVELTVKNSTTDIPYHCHAVFSNAITQDNIDSLNAILDSLYPDKNLQVAQSENARDLSQILDAFIDYEYLLLPHGGQAHSCFLDSLPKGEPGKGIDKAFEMELYHNHFDGFTGRNERSVDRTKAWFEKLGVSTFTNLLTCSDNYQPSKYPEPKNAVDGTDFTPTWMLSEATFAGLRLALSESSRLHYDKIPPHFHTEHVSRVALSNDYISINTHLTPGLNVVIGGSSSGKTLFVDSLVASLSNDFSESAYKKKFGVDKIEVTNSSGRLPHYINQNFIIKELTSGKVKLENIALIKNAFPSAESSEELITKALETVNKSIASLIAHVERIFEIEDELNKLGGLVLMVSASALMNILDLIRPSDTQRNSFQYSSVMRAEHQIILDEIEHFLDKSTIIETPKTEIEVLRSRLDQAALLSDFEEKVFGAISSAKSKRSFQLQEQYGEEHAVSQDRNNLFALVAEYVTRYDSFENDLAAIVNSGSTEFSKPVSILNYTLKVENTFRIDEQQVVEALNELFVSDNRLSAYEDIAPHTLALSLFDNRKVTSYESLKTRLEAYLKEKYETIYHIEDSEGKSFYDMSPGWQTATLLDIILCNTSDFAPIIIDQPEDNLAMSYINGSLITSLKKVKKDKQVILVSHNATIPMLGDAQCVVVCRNEDGFISVDSAPLEGEVAGISTLDWIADITDGGKPAIRKRVKKYNIKSLQTKGEQHESEVC